MKSLLLLLCLSSITLLVSADNNTSIVYHTTWQQYQQLNFHHNPAGISQFKTFVNFAGGMQFTQQNVKIDDSLYTYPYFTSQSVYLNIPKKDKGVIDAEQILPYKHHKVFLNSSITLEGLFQKHSMRGSYAYEFNAKQYLISIGATFNYQLYKLDFSQATFSDQIDPIKGFVSPTSEPIPHKTSTQLSSGLGFYITPGNRKWYISGFVDNLIANNDVTFYNYQAGGKPPKNTYLQAGYSYFKGNYGILPNASYTNIYNISSLMIGSDFLYKKWILGAKSNFDNTIQLNAGYNKHYGLRVMANYSVYNQDGYNFNKGTAGLLIGYSF